MTQVPLKKKGAVSRQQSTVSLQGSSGLDREQSGLTQAQTSQGGPPTSGRCGAMKAARGHLCRATAAAERPPGLAGAAVGLHLSCTSVPALLPLPFRGG